MFSKYVCVCVCDYQPCFSRMHSGHELAPSISRSTCYTYITKTICDILQPASLTPHNNSGFVSLFPQLMWLLQAKNQVPAKVSWKDSKEREEKQRKRGWIRKQNEEEGK